MRYRKGEIAKKTTLLDNRHCKITYFCIFTFHAQSTCDWGGGFASLCWVTNARMLCGALLAPVFALLSVCVYVVMMMTGFTYTLHWIAILSEMDVHVCIYVHVPFLYFLRIGTKRPHPSTQTHKRTQGSDTNTDTAIGTTQAKKKKLYLSSRSSNIAQPNPPPQNSQKKTTLNLCVLLRV